MNFIFERFNNRMTESLRIYHEFINYITIIDWWDTLGYTLNNGKNLFLFFFKPLYCIKIKSRLHINIIISNGILYNIFFPTVKWARIDDVLLSDSDRINVFNKSVEIFVNTYYINRRSVTFSQCIIILFQYYHVRITRDFQRRGIKMANKMIVC